jgi:hypothetical protein
MSRKTILALIAIVGVTLGSAAGALALLRRIGLSRERHPRRVRSFILGGGKMAHPTRFERVTFAFGGRVHKFAQVCGCLKICIKPLFYKCLLMDAVADLC